ncbi:MAG: glycine cleavage system protein GcvH [Candidatus Scalindua rubra]|uniref:Glycine cleavage system H protein n=1 Tax=Candidatus Scalindua brodae TaxID=237368 RepID=A0A0B0ENB1_9BACT|nr:MAG: H-protein of the glycine cleavage system [Candidatus Scalindua brodae]MBZ0109016.1 glycine cleavage system protein GcvH [Candidatus Scalindua rubra]
MGNPIDRKYTKEHEWIKIDGDIAIVGITDFAQDQLTDVVFVELPEVGKQVDQNGNLCVVESVKSVSDIFSPISGEIVEVNRTLEDSPVLINNEPFEGGWIVKLKVNNETELDQLMTSEEYNKFLAGIE